jgi:hypothetical protein
VLPVEVDRDGLVLRHDGLGVTLRAAAAAPPGPALLAIRPERLRLAAAQVGAGQVQAGQVEAGQGPNRLDGVVVARTYAGETLTHAVRLPDGTQLRVSQALSDGLRPGLPAVGDPVVLSWPPEAGMLLPA